MSDNPNLPDRHERFCQEYIVDLNGKKAGIRAGYSPRTAESQASRLLRNAKVQARIAELQAERSERTAIDADWTLQKLKLVADRCTAEKTFDAAGANRSLQLIGMHQGIFEADNRQRTPRSDAERIAAVDREIEEMMARGNPGNGAATRH